MTPHDEPTFATSSEASLQATIDHARVTSRRLMQLGWAVVVIAVAGIVVTLALWAHGDLDMEQALGTLLGTVLVSILSGTTAYAAGVNLRINGERLALALEADPAHGAPRP